MSTQDATPRPDAAGQTPWKASFPGGTFTTGAALAGFIADGDGRTIAYLPAGAAVEANASLLSSAPALLAACKAALAVGEALERPDDENQRIYLGKCVVDQLRAAVALAEKGGES